MEDFEYHNLEYGELIKMSNDRKVITIDGESMNGEDYLLIIQKITNLIEKFPDAAYLYEKRGHIYRYARNDDKALDDYLKAESLGLKKSHIYYNIANIHFEFKDYHKALIYTEKGIACGEELTLFYLLKFKGLIYKEMCEFEKALLYFDKAFSLGFPISHVFHANKAIIHFNLNMIAEGYKELNRYIFKGHISKKNYAMPAIFLDKLTYYPFTIYEHFKNFGTNIDLTTLTYFNEVNKLGDFLLLLEFIDKYPDLEEKDKISLKCLLYNYLGSPVFSLIHILEELLPRFGFSNLKGKDWYLYIKLLDDIGLKVEEFDIITECVNNLSLIKMEDEDIYYLGHIYLLKGDNDNAIKSFESSNTIWSKIMLAYLKEDKDLSKHIDIKSLYEYDTDLFPENGDLQQWNISNLMKYIHNEECYFAIEFLQEDLHFDSQQLFWDTFNLSKNSKKELTNLLRAWEGKRIKEEVYSLFEKEFNSVSENRNLTTEELKKIFFENNLLLKRIVREIEEDKKDNLDIENQLGLIIDEWRVNTPKLYFLLIQYFTLKKYISPKECFNLYCFCIYKIQKVISNLKLSIIESLTKSLSVVLPPLAMTTVLYGSKRILEIYENLLTDAFEGVTEINNYQNFKENLWKFIIYDRQVMSEERFINKYSCFKWFGMKKAYRNE